MFPEPKLILRLFGLWSQQCKTRRLQRFKTKKRTKVCRIHPLGTMNVGVKFPSTAVEIFQCLSQNSHSLQI